MNKEIQHLRTDYGKSAIEKEDLNPDPVKQFEQWFQEAQQAEIPDVNAMVLSTVSKDQRPSSRVILLKGVEDHSFVFYTNYQSDKGAQMEENPYVALNFFWQQLERQVRVEGKVEKVAPEVSDAYFNSRPEASRIGAWASPQSQAIASREALELAVYGVIQKFQNTPITRPPHWGGYKVIPDYIEFWQGRPCRLHDRFTYRLKEEGLWKIERLAP